MSFAGLKSYQELRGVKEAIRSFRVSTKSAAGSAFAFSVPHASPFARRSGPRVPVSEKFQRREAPALRLFVAPPSRRHSWFLVVIPQAAVHRLWM